MGYTGPVPDNLNALTPEEVNVARASPSDSGSDARRLERWQRRLLPLMTRLLVGLAIFFFTISLAQMSYLAWRIERNPTVDLRPATAILTRSSAKTANDAVETSRALAMELLESNALERRYHQANVILMARVWTSYLGFVTGMIISLIGAAFTLGRIQGGETTIEAKLSLAAGTLRTAMAGLALIALGVILMIASLFVRYDIKLADPTYLYSKNAANDSAANDKPPVVLFPSSTINSDTKRP